MLYVTVVLAVAAHVAIGAAAVGFVEAYTDSQTTNITSAGTVLLWPVVVPTVLIITAYLAILRNANQYGRSLGENVRNREPQPQEPVVESYDVVRVELGA